MASTSSLFSCFLLLLLHLACFNFTSSSSHHSQSKKRKPSPVSLNTNQSAPPPSRHKLSPRKALSSSLSFFKRLLAAKQSSITKPSSSPTRPLNVPSIPAPCSSTGSLTQPTEPIAVPLTSADSSHELSVSDSDISSDQEEFFDMYPCPICVEIFPKLILLEQHQSVKHAVSELIDRDTGKNTVPIIDKTGWPGKMKTPIILSLRLSGDNKFKKCNS